MASSTEFKVVEINGYTGITIPPGHPWHQMEEVSGPGLTLHGSAYKGEWVAIFGDQSHDADSVIRIAKDQQTKGKQQPEGKQQPTEIPFRYEIGDRVRATNGRGGTVTERYKTILGNAKMVVTLDAWEGRAKRHGVHYDQTCLDPEDPEREKIAAILPQATPEQIEAIGKQIKVYDLPDTPCDGLSHFTDWGKQMEDLSEGKVAVAFHYIPEDGGDTPGLEVTIFNADGSVAESQDFG